MSNGMVGGYAYSAANVHPHAAHVQLHGHARRPDGAAGSAVARSPLLEEFWNRSRARWSIQDLQGHIIEFSTDQHGSRFIQERMTSQEPAAFEEREIVFDEVIVEPLRMMDDVFGNYVRDLA